MEEMLYFKKEQFILKVYVWKWTKQTISRPVKILQPKHVAYINQVFHGFVGTTKNLVLRPIHLCLRKKINMPKKLTGQDNFHEDSVHWSVLDVCERGEFPSVKETISDQK
jgi:hypothetical protein